MWEAVNALQGWIHAVLTARVGSFAATATGDRTVLLGMLPLGVAFGQAHCGMVGNGQGRGSRVLVATPHRRLVPRRGRRLRDRVRSA